MTSAPWEHDGQIGPPQPASRPGSALAAAILGALASALAACGGDPPPAPPPPPHPSTLTRSVESLDGALTAGVPADLVIHPMETSVLATATDASFRLYVGWAGDPTLIRHVGAAKELMQARGWRLTSERHYEAAAEITSEMGSPLEKRTTWLIVRGRRVLTCDGIAVEPQAHRLEPLKALCQAVELTPLPPEPEPDAE